MHRMSRLALVTALIAGTALASEEYRGTLMTATQSDVSLPCQVCHDRSSPLGGRGTVTQPFGLALMDRGLSDANAGMLQELLAEFREQNVDTDGDGTSDFDELSLGRNPNVPGPNDCYPGSTACSDGGLTGDLDGGVELQIPPVTFGCSAGAGGGALMGLVLSGAALVVAQRRRR
ncbi:MAG: thrombospondin type 3 repeat-containing protein [Myxococcaceae bacterium]|nr:thrombospondin type 3 repeat-containing protein [Myxococcaceae bacterium]